MPKTTLRPLPLSTLLSLLSSHPSLSPTLHAPILKTSSLAYPIPATALLTAYANAGLPDAASHLFDEMPARDVVAWNALLACLVRHTLPGVAAASFHRMIAAGFAPTASTLCTLVKASAASRALRPGQQVHAQSVLACHGDVVMATALINLYMSCGLVGDAMKVFAHMSCLKDATVYNAVLSGCVDNGWYREAFLMLRKISVNDIALTCALTACSATSNLANGMQVHCMAVRFGFDSETVLCNALIDMYAKCGRKRAARVVFDRMAQKNVVSWSSMVDAYSRHGCGEEALNLFKRMEEGKPTVLPNAVTFLAVLSACGHSGLVEEGRAHLHLMKNKYGIDPEPEHYACFIHSLGRAGRVDEAWAIYCNLSANQNKLHGAICVAMLNACRANMDIARGNKIAAHLQEMDPQNPGSHVLISNFHAAARSWSEVDESRRLIMNKGLTKKAASSHVSIGN